ncbi:hypothetical protein [Nostoc sp.]
MEKIVVELSEVLKKRRWDFSLFSSASRKTDEVLQKINIQSFDKRNCEKNSARFFWNT